MELTPGFRIETSGTGTESAIELAGELDESAASSLVDAFERALSVPGCEQLTLDLRQLAFVDSAGMRAIIEIERAARDRGVQLVVLPPPEAVTALLQTAGVCDRITVGPVEQRPPSPFIERIDLRLAIDTNAPGEARSEIRQAAAHMSAEMLSVATLLVSELVTNAVIHPVRRAVSVGLRIITAEDRLRVEVTDSGDGFDPARPEPRTPDRGGRGLLLVDRLASRWGAGRRGDGNKGFCVWFELDFAAPPARPV